MKEIKVPVFPESVQDGILTRWHKLPGDEVHSGDIIADVETDKVVFEVPAQADGRITERLVEEKTTVMAEQVIARMEEGEVTATTKTDAEKKQVEQGAAKQPRPEKTATEPVAETVAVMPAAKRIIEENLLDATQISGSGKGGRILKQDVQKFLQDSSASEEKAPDYIGGERPERRLPMTRLRQRIAERLLEAQQSAAILTTFNEIDMQPVMDLRQRYRDEFEKQHQVRLGFMSFFVAAAVEALKRFPEVNASIEGDDIVYHGFFDIGVAVGTPRGLVVPILRNADQMSMAQVEKKIADLASRAQDGKLGLEEITGGTFSITNGGVFGSLLSTPIINPPQSAILGMHKIEKRPMVVQDEIVIRPMMYVALSYDHRLIDGREAVQFLVTIKDFLEEPARMLLEI